MPPFPHLEDVVGKPQGPSTRPGAEELEGFEAPVLPCRPPSSAPHLQLMPSACGKWPGGIPASPPPTWDPAPAGAPSSGKRDPSWGRSTVRAGGPWLAAGLWSPRLCPLSPLSPPLPSQLSPAARAPQCWRAARGTCQLSPSAGPPSPARTSAPGASSTACPPPASKRCWDGDGFLLSRPVLGSRAGGWGGTGRRSASVAGCCWVPRSCWGSGPSQGVRQLRVLREGTICAPPAQSTPRGGHFFIRKTVHPSVPASPSSGSLCLPPPPWQGGWQVIPPLQVSLPLWELPHSSCCCSGRGDGESELGPPSLWGLPRHTGGAGRHLVMEPPPAAPQQAEEGLGEAPQPVPPARAEAGAAVMVLAGLMSSCTCGGGRVRGGPCHAGDRGVLPLTGVTG